MANYNQNNNGGNNQSPRTTSDHTDDQALTATMRKFASLSYNPAGFLPSTSVFRVTLSQLKPLVLAFTQDFLSDISNVTFVINHKTGVIDTFVWMPNDSKDLRDTSAMTDRSAIKVPITRYSPALKDFMKRFCDPDKCRTIGEENGMNLVGVQIDLARLAKLMFDESGVRFQKEFGGFKVATSIRLVANFAKSGDDRNFGSLRYLEITKSTRTGLEETEPKPKKSFKAI